MASITIVLKENCAGVFFSPTWVLVDSYSDDGPCICAERGHLTKRSRDFDEIEEDNVSCMELNM